MDMGGNGARLDGKRGTFVPLMEIAADKWTEITKADREEREQWIDKESQRLVNGGTTQAKAKRKAGERWVEENPWWKEGSTRGRV